MKTKQNYIQPMLACFHICTESPLQNGTITENPSSTPTLDDGELGAKRSFFFDVSDNVESSYNVWEE